MTLVSKQQYACDFCHMLYSSYVAANACCDLEGWHTAGKVEFERTEDEPDLFTDMLERFTTREDMQAPE